MRRQTSANVSRRILACDPAVAISAFEVEADDHARVIDAVRLGRVTARLADLLVAASVEKEADLGLGGGFVNADDLPSVVERQCRSRDRTRHVECGELTSIPEEAVRNARSINVEPDDLTVIVDRHWGSNDRPRHNDGGKFTARPEIPLAGRGVEPLETDVIAAVVEPIDGCEHAVGDVEAFVGAIFVEEPVDCAVAEEVGAGDHTAIIHAGG